MEPLNKIPKDTSVFIDANIFIYHFCASHDIFSDRCTDFFLRIENNELFGFSTTSVVAETMHRAMIYEATQKTGFNAKKSMNMLRKKPNLIKQLSFYSLIPEKILEIGVQVLSLTYQTLQDSQYWRSKYGLMVNDSLILASMQSLNSINLATNDADFDKIPSLTVWKPSV